MPPSDNACNHLCIEQGIVALQRSLFGGMMVGSNKEVVNPAGDLGEVKEEKNATYNIWLRRRLRCTDVSVSMENQPIAIIF